MKEIRNKTFKNETVELDGFAFYDCIFDGSHLIFRGGDHFGFDKPIFAGQTTMEFTDSAKLTLKAFDALYLDAFYRDDGSAVRWIEGMLETFKLPLRKIDH